MYLMLLTVMGIALRLLPGHWQVQPEPEASREDPATPLSRATVVNQRNPAKRRTLHKRTGSRTFGNYPRHEPTIADILRRTGIATDLRRSTRRVGAKLALASTPKQLSPGGRLSEVRCLFRV